MTAAVSKLDWPVLRDRLNEDGFAVTESFLSARDCKRLEKSYDSPRSRFRSIVDMARHNFGRGEYRYFEYPLPRLVASLRQAFYAQLAPVANEWAARLGEQRAWPDTLRELTELCHAEGQNRPTPLMLRYVTGDYNCLHQDLYGAIHFPLQVVILLSDPHEDFEGGELVLVEQRPRMQSRAVVMRLRRGAAAIIPVRERPRQGVRGYHRAAWRHGVSEVLSGTRLALGLIFHDAR